MQKAWVNQGWASRSAHQASKGWGTSTHRSRSPRSGGTDKFSLRRSQQTSNRLLPPSHRKSETFPVVARLLSGRSLCTVLVSLEDPIAVLRLSVAEAIAADEDAGAKASRDGSNFDLVFNGRVLADRDVVQAVGLQTGADVTVLRTTPFKILVAFEDRVARIFDGVTGVCQRRFGGHRNALKTAAFSPDGKQVVTASDDFMVKIFCAETGRCTSTIRVHRNNVNMASFSPDGLNVLTASDDGTARLVSESGNVTYKGHRNVVNSAVFSPDGMLVLTASDDKLARIFDTWTGHCIRTFEGHKGPVQCAVFSSDGKRVLTGSHDGFACIFDAQSGERQIQLEHNGQVRAATFSPDDARLVTVASDVKVYNAQTGVCERVLIEEDLEFVASAVFSADGDKILTASDTNGVVRLYNLSTGECQRTYEVHECKPSKPAASSAVFAPIGAS